MAKMQGKCRFNHAWQDIYVYEWVLPDPNRDVVEGKRRLLTFFYLVNYRLPTYCVPIVDQRSESEILLTWVLITPASANYWNQE